MFNKKKQAKVLPVQPELLKEVISETADPAVDSATEPTESPEAEKPETVDPSREVAPGPANEETEESPSENAEEPANEEPENPANEEAEEPANEEADDWQKRIEEAYRIGAGIDEETFNNAKALLNNIAEAVNSGSFNPELIQTALRLLNYDRLVEEARKSGYETGRGEKAAEAFRNKRAAAESAASIPHLQGTKGMASPLSDSIFDLARGAF